MNKPNFWRILFAFVCLISVNSCKREILRTEKKDKLSSELSINSNTSVNSINGEFDARTFGMSLMANTGFVSFVKEFAIGMHKVGLSTEPSCVAEGGFIFLDSVEAEVGRDQFIQAFAVFSDANKDFFLL